MNWNLKIESYHFSWDVLLTNITCEEGNLYVIFFGIVFVILIPLKLGKFYTSIYYYVYLRSTSNYSAKLIFFSLRRVAAIEQ